jgi:hypothetical protein
MQCHCANRVHLNPHLLRIAREHEETRESFHQSRQFREMRAREGHRSLLQFHGEKTNRVLTRCTGVCVVREQIHDQRETHAGREKVMHLNRGVESREDRNHSPSARRPHTVVRSLSNSVHHSRLALSRLRASRETRNHPMRAHSRTIACQHTRVPPAFALQTKATTKSTTNHKGDMERKDLVNEIRLAEHLRDKSHRHESKMP